MARIGGDRDGDGLPEHAWFSNNHSNQIVPLYAYGANAELVRGLADDLDLGPPEVLERDDPGETGAVDHVPRVRQDVDRQTDVPYLPYAEYAVYRFEREKNAPSAQQARTSSLYPPRRSVARLCPASELV